MGIFPGWFGHAWYRHAADSNNDRRKPQTRLCRCTGFAAGLILAGLCATAEPIRIATFNTELSQIGPGLLLRDILHETDQVNHVAKTIVDHSPDILVLQGFDYDANNAALTAFRDLLTQRQLSLPYIYAPMPNTGLPTGIDLDGDGRTYGPRDAQGYGQFPGASGIAVLSRYPIETDAVHTFTDVLWKTAAPDTDLAPLLPADAHAVQRLSSVAAVAIPIEKDGMRFWVLTHHATPPVFDGPEDRNGFRNADENRFWLTLRRQGFPTDPFVIAAQMNVDPERGEGHHDVILDILTAPEVSDPFAQWLSEDNHTVTYPAPGPGKLRVSYLLPSADLAILNSGISRSFAPQKDRSRHRLIWVDVDFTR